MSPGTWSQCDTCVRTNGPFGVDKEQNGRYHVVNSVTNTGPLLVRYLVTHLTGIDDDGPRDNRHKQHHLKAQRSHRSEVRARVL